MKRVLRRFSLWRRGFAHGYELALVFALDQLEETNPCHDRVRDALNEQLAALHGEQREAQR